MPLPLFKLGALLAKQISKPLGKLLKEKAKQNERFKKYFVLPAANVYHNIDVTLRMRILGLGSPDKVPPLTEKAAIELGGDILSEFFVFGTAVALILIEYARQASNKTKQDNALQQKVLDLESDNVTLKEKLDQNTKRLGEISVFLQDQKTLVNDMNGKLNKLLGKKKFVNAQVQTTNGKQIGKVMVAKQSNIQPGADVTNSIVYQCAQSAVDGLLGKN